MKDDRWVEGRLALLEPSRDWRPDASAALARVRERDRAWRGRRRWMGVAMAASLVSMSVLAIPGRCDSPGSTSCGQPLAGRIWTSVFSKPVDRGIEIHPPLAVIPSPGLAPPVALVAQSGKAPVRPPAAAAAPALVRYKESGAPDAPVACEVYTDYECPSCAVLYRQTIPSLITQYVQTGKVKLLHRDFPLPQHPYARLAARYANAAGRLGYYEQAVNQIFQTQNAWSANGSVDAQLAQVLAPGVMQKVRDMAQNDATLDQTVAEDVAMARKDAINQTPTIVVVVKGKRQPIAGAVDFGLLKTYLDQVLK